MLCRFEGRQVDRVPVARLDAGWCPPYRRWSERVSKCAAFQLAALRVRWREIGSTAWKERATTDAAPRESVRISRRVSTAVVALLTSPASQAPGGSASAPWSTDQIPYRAR